MIYYILKDGMRTVLNIFDDYIRKTLISPSYHMINQCLISPSGEFLFVFNICESATLTLPSCNIIYNTQFQYE